MISNNIYIYMSVLFRRFVYLLLLCVFKYMSTLVFVVELFVVDLFESCLLREHVVYKFIIFAGKF